jgi:hypothetical protein
MRNLPVGLKERRFELLAGEVQGLSVGLAQAGDD